MAETNGSPDMHDAFKPHHLNLVHELERSGLRRLPGIDPRTYEGVVSDGGDSWPVCITLTDGYPARPPQVRLANPGIRRSWHEYGDGSMCLYPTSTVGHFPWLAPGNLLQRVRSWCRQRADGWPNDEPDLDLHRYWPRCPRYGLLIHGPLNEGCSGWRRLQRVPDTRTLRECGLQAPPKKRGRRHPYIYAVLCDLGELHQPATTWDELLEVIPGSSDEAATVLLGGRAQILLARYTRTRNVGALAIEVQPAKGGVRLTSIATAEDSPLTLNLRRGPYLTALATARVAIIGVGAVGSHIAVNLHRAGVGHLSLCDHEDLRPGNMARHAAAASFVGWNKARAMDATLRTDDQTVEPSVDPMVDLDRALVLVEQHDLVVDATADDSVANLLAFGAQDLGKPIISTYLANQGRSKVVEVITGPTSGWASTTSMAPIGPDAYESGCGDPVSPTPLFEIQAVAATAARTAIQRLLGRDNTTEVQETP